MEESDLAIKKSEKDPSYWSRYKRLRNKITYELRKRVQEYYHKLVDETQSDPKAKWKKIHKVLHSNSNRMVRQQIIFKGTELKSSIQISEPFNKHFITVGLNLAEKIISQPSDDAHNYSRKRKQ